MNNVLWEPQPGPQTALVTCPIFEVFFGGARGGGKTEGSIGDWISHSTEWGMAANGIFFRREEKQLDEVVERTRELLEPMGAKFNAQKSTWRMKNGARLKFRYLDRDKDAEAYQGHSYSRIYIEEATNFPSFAPIKKLFATLRSARGAHVGIRLTGNPGGPGHRWVFDRYIRPAPQGLRILEDLVEIDGFQPTLRQRVFIPSSLKDNKYLGNEYAANLAMQGSTALVRAWLFGDWSSPVGAYFTQFSRDRHVLPAKFAAVIPDNALRFGSLDWGYAAPFSFGKWAVSDGTWGLPRGALLRYDELYGSTGEANTGVRMDAAHVAQAIKARIGLDKLAYIAADPSMFKKDGGPSHAETFAMNGVYLRRADNNRQGGWDKVRQHLNGWLGPQEDAPPHHLPPLIYILDHCKASIEQLESVPADPDKPDDVDTKAEDHAVDELRYGVMSRPWIIESLPPLSERKVTLDELWETNERRKRMELV